MLTLFAAGALQRFGDLIVLGTVLALAGFGYQNGVFLAVLAGMHALVSLVVSLAFVQPMAAFLASMEMPEAYTFPAAYGILLGGTAVAIRLAVGGYVPADVVRFAPLIDKLGGGLVGAVAGVIVAGVILIAMSVAPVPETLLIEGRRLKYDMGTRMLETFARCVEPDNEKRKILLDGEPGTPLPPPPPVEPVAAAPAPAKRDEPDDQPAAETEGDKKEENGGAESGASRKKPKVDKPPAPPPPPPPPPPQASEPFGDTNGNKAYDEGEPYIDTDGNQAFTPKLLLNDTNGNGRRDIGLLEQYRLHTWGPRAMAPLVVLEPIAGPPPGDAGAAPPPAAAPQPPPKP